MITSGKQGRLYKVDEETFQIFKQRDDKKIELCFSMKEKLKKELEEKKNQDCEKKCAGDKDCMNLCLNPEKEIPEKILDDLQEKSCEEKDKIIEDLKK